MYCPCCGSEHEKFEKVCLDCRVPLLPGNSTERSSNNLCDCDDEPLGEYLTFQLEGAEDLVKEKVREITGFTKEDDVSAYIRKIVKWNSQQG